MQESFSRRLLGLILLLILPGTLLAQSRNQTTPPATPTTQAKPAAANEKPADKQTATPGETPKGKEAKGKFTLKVASGPVRAVDLKANAASVAEIAAKLSKEFEIPVLLSPVMQKARVSIEFESMPLEGAVRMIAPQPYADYEISGDGSTMAKIVALYLYALNEPPPSESAVVRGDSEAILISGDTEEGTERAAKDEQETSLSVKIERNQFTVHAVKQPLTAVLYEIATKVDIPFEMKYDSSEVVNVDLKNATIEQVVRTLSPNIRLYQRTDLQTYETRPLRLVLAQPTSQTIKM
ncbi:MAG TPA: hypothetical protein VFH15_14070 [Pyrinomonadaceae bacterium]|nr:hypothetical protein [Pyrinomonadaceae bacterium]